MKRTWILAIAACVALGGVLRADTIDSTAGLVYHLTADSGVTSSGGSVSAWTDANSVYTFSQGSASLQPTLVSNAINGHSAIEFTASNTTQLTSIASCTIQTVFVVCRTYSTMPSNGGMWGEYIDGKSYTDIGIRRSSSTSWDNSNNNCFGYGGTTTINGASTYSDTASAWEILVVTASTAKTWNGTSVGNYFILSGYASRAWSGEIAELATFSGALTSAQINSIGYALSQKYGITTTYTVPEPGTMAMIGSGLTALCCLVWRKRRNKK